MHDVCSLSNSKGIWTRNHLVRKQTLNHLANLAKTESFCLPVFPSTYLSLLLILPLKQE